MRDQANTDDRPLQGQGVLDTPRLGGLWLVWSAVGLVQVRWPEQGRLEDGPPERTIPRHYAEPLSRYLQHKPVDPALVAIDPRGTPFQLRVWEALRQVRRGTVRSYAGIAKDVGSPRAMRAVGSANAHNPLPLVVPCHRIVEAGNRLGGYSGGLERKKLLLELEGVRVDESDRVLPGQLELL
ncbi:MAG: methylated-DNA--[protein]-cysteine S-methyltransferase [Myxococcota bacterium]